MTLKYTALESIFTALSTELNSLTNTSIATSSVIDNDTAISQRWTMAGVEVFIATQGTNRVVGAHVSLYIIPTVDGTNYGDTTGACKSNYHVKTWHLDDTATASRYLTGIIPLPPTDYKVVLENQTGQTLASSGNTVKIREFSAEEV